MNSTSKKTAGVRSIPQPTNRPAGHVAQSKLVVANSKISVSTQSVDRFIGPPVYKPQPLQTGVQAKMAAALAKTAVTTQSDKRSVAPPAYRPQAVPKVLQTKKTVSSQARQGVVQLWRNVPGQDGEFEGDPAHHHLHRAGGTEHYKYGNNQRTRINYMNGAVVNYGNIERAIERCEGHQNATGRNEVLAELRRLLAARPAPPPAVDVPAVPAAGAAAPAPVAPAPAEEKKGNKKKNRLEEMGKRLAAKSDF